MKQQENRHQGYWSIVWRQFRQHRLGYVSMGIVVVMALVGIYAPFLASSQPLVVRWNGEWYFPLFRHLFYTGFYTKRLDIFYNILMFTLPAALIAWKTRWRVQLLALLAVVQFSLFAYFGYFHSHDPTSDPELNQRRYEVLRARRSTEGDPFLAPLDQGPSWDFDRRYLNSYGQLEQVLRYHIRKQQHERLQRYRSNFAEAALDRWLVQELVRKRQELFSSGVSHDMMPERETLRQAILDDLSEQEKQAITEVPTLWSLEQENEAQERQRYQETMERYRDDYPEAKALLTPILEKCGDKPLALGGDVADELQPLLQQCDPAQLSDMVRGKLSGLRRTVEEFEVASAHLQYLTDRRVWLDTEENNLGFLLMPLLRNFHWEDDAGGEQNLNRFLPWYERTRINRKDLLPALLFGIRISLVVGLLAVGLAVAIGIPVGAVAGYYGGRFDIVVSRLLEVWESMPTFFMLLLVVAITQSKSIFLVIAVIGLFGWTGFARYMRGEVLKQRNLSYVEACHAVGFPDRRIIFSHILPNAVPPILTLLPFAIMAAITSEAGLSFLGLGEEGSCSWGVLMDEGRNAFPGESYLLWPPAIMLTTLLVAIALVGDAFRDSLDPKLRKN